MKQAIKLITTTALTLCISALSLAEETPETVRAYAAGYKAAFTCSAVFNGGKTTTQIAAEELDGIYPLVADIVKSLPRARIDQRGKSVMVPYSDTMPPRISQWRPHLGCTQLPVGAGPGAALALPMVDLDVPERDDSAPWKRIPASYGASDNAALADLTATAFSNPDYGKDARTTALLVATPDEILVERYKEGFDHRTSQRTWSVAKSIAASVIGAAVQKNLVGVYSYAPIKNWQSPGDPRASITLENLLHMASGLDSNRAGNRTDRLYLGGGRVADTAQTTALEAAPGSRWKYANNDTLLAMRALRDTMDNDQAYWEFPFTHLLHKIGMLDTVPEMDWGGDFILSSQVWTTSRDLARLGILYLQDGLWNGERLLPADWSRYVANPAPVQPPEKRSNGRRNPGYGAQFWLYNERYPELPNDTYAALGNRGQILMIIPSKNLVIVRRGHDPAGGEGFRMERFAADVLKVLAN